MVNFAELVIGIVFILLMAMVFTNALEHLGGRLGISEGVTGSIFVAVGTALPETIVPVIALFSHSNSALNNVNEEIGVGAILGPPLMLSTLSIGLMAISVLKKRGFNGLLRPEKTGFNRDLRFFGIGYLLAVLLAVSHKFYVNRLIDIFVVIILMMSYFIYVLLTVRASKGLVQDGHVTEADHELYLKHYFKLPDNLTIIIIQALLGFAGLVYFANIFIEGIHGASAMLGIPAFLISVVLIPIATELPEKINSILWVRKGKDTLAMANITGAMVFQGLLLPVMGILLTDWQLPLDKAISCIVTFIAVSWLLINSTKGRRLKVWHLVINGLLYLISISVSLMVFS